MAKQLSKKRNQVQKVVKRAKTTTKVSAEKAQKPSVTLPKGEYVEAVGRRKVATARVRIYLQAGDFLVNEQAAGQYFDEVLNAPSAYNKPLELADLKGKVSVVAKVSGSGVSSQLGAVIHGLARALVKHNIDLKPVLKAEGLLTRDDRMKESRKIGHGGKARRKRQSPKR